MESDIWKGLINLCNLMEQSLDNWEDVVRTQEEGLEKFNTNGWKNLTWSSYKFRRAHIDVVDARETKGLWMMHVCIMPHYSSDAPIFGFDVIAGKNKITGAFLDLSPTTNSEHELSETLKIMKNSYSFGKERELPDWAKQIFSDHMIAAGNIKAGTDDFNFIIGLAFTIFIEYLDNVGKYNGRSDEEIGKACQNKYAYYQKQNPHTPKVMKSLGLDNELVDQFIGECLFPETE